MTPNSREATYAPRPPDIFRNDPVPEWIVRRFERIEKNPPRYEASLRGPHNAILNSYFPPHRNFLIKTEPKLRTTASSAPSPPATGRTSIDSNGREVECRNDDDIPDFMVCSATDDLHGDIPLLIWELKRNFGPNANQILRYHQWAFDVSEGRPDGQRGILVCLVEGNYVTSYTLHRGGGKWISHTELSYAHILSLEIHEMLLSIADTV
ncbi:hypothetical protein HGRIS_010417 [Hohenbuehelia grisea]|uniref:Uncharacterized protein n=1 Tax=Hohenbuehelia grisea TaxID=104357 RepID=A0ABR3J4H3_9AGAR